MGSLGRVNRRLPIAFGINLDFIGREITHGAPATQWWISLLTAIVFGLGFATILTLIVMPAALMGIANLAAKKQIWRDRWRECRAVAVTAKAARQQFFGNVFCVTATISASSEFDRQIA